MEKYEDSTKALLAKVALPPNCPNEDLPFRTDDDEPHWLGRPFHFLHSPIVKFIHHLVYWCLYLGLFCYVMLFGFFSAFTLERGDKDYEFLLPLADYGYFRIKFTECVIIFWTTLHFIELIRQMFLGDAFGSGAGKILTRMKNHLTNMWNIYEIIMFAIFYSGVVFRLFVSFLVFLEKRHCLKLWFDIILFFSRQLKLIVLLGMKNAWKSDGKSIWIILTVTFLIHIPRFWIVDISRIKSRNKD